MMVVSLVVLGIVSYFELKVDLFPNVDIPVVSITTIYPGVAPETVETEVTRRIEEAVNPIGGIKHVDSVTTEGVVVGGPRIPAEQEHQHGAAGNSE